MTYTIEFEKVGQLKDYDKIILMSKSPRRKDLLSFLNPELDSLELDEKQIQDYYMEKYKDLDFFTRVGQTSCHLAKAKSGKNQEGKSLYISSDTMVLCDEKIYNKPKDKKEADEMFRSYFGKVHQVISGVCLRSVAYEELFFSYANIKFVDYNKGLEDMIREYVNSDNPMDKAGAYGIQEISPAFIEYIEGDINTIIGLPLSQITRRIL